ncbi:MAG: Hsp20/alpha crystallin family protein [wastewater metagenome]|nr:Hsp20/alpha crystallin family protein [Candidatus Loosdrechtia aerotolerans]
MALNHINIEYKTESQHENLENLFKDLVFFSKHLQVSSATPWQPPTDVYETPDEMVVKMSIPGAKPEDIQITFSKQTLTIHGYREDTSPHEKTCFYQVELRYGYFERNIFIPMPVDVDNTQALYKDGFLQVTLPKVKQQSSGTFFIKIHF